MYIILLFDLTRGGFSTKESNPVSHPIFRASLINSHTDLL